MESPKGSHNCIFFGFLQEILMAIVPSLFFIPNLAFSVNPFPTAWSHIPRLVPISISSITSATPLSLCSSHTALPIGSKYMPCLPTSEPLYRFYTMLEFSLLCTSLLSPSQLLLLLPETHRQSCFLCSEHLILHGFLNCLELFV